MQSWDEPLAPEERLSVAKRLYLEHNLFRRFVKATERMVYSVIWAVGCRKEDVAGVYQDTYLKFYNSLNPQKDAAGYRGECSLRSWLRVIAVRKAIDSRRSRGRRGNVEQQWPEDDSAVESHTKSPGPPSPEESVVWREAVALVGLSEDEEAVMECQLRQMSIAETAEVLGVSERTVYALRKSAWAKIRRVAQEGRVPRANHPRAATKTTQG